MENKFSAPPFLPATRLHQPAANLTILEPLSRRGSGPGLIILVPETGKAASTTLRIEGCVPSPLMKWAEESYTVAEIVEAGLANPEKAINQALKELEATKSTEPKNAVGIIAYSTALWNQVAPHVDSFSQISGAVIFGDLTGDENSGIVSSKVPQLHHLAGSASKALPRTKAVTAYDYPKANSYLFATPFSKDFSYNMESVSHSRSLSFLKPLMNGPYFDLEVIWDEHTYWEFDNRSVVNTMNTMVQEPYVNHVPTMTGGIGREKLTVFYRDHFIFQNPPDTETYLISRSVGIDRVIDEFIFICTHHSQIDWLAPGIPPTGRKLEIPFTAVVNIRGDRLYHEHIGWDQGTVLAQLGLMPSYLPYPHPVPNAQSQEKLEYRVPIGGVETAEKLRDKEAVESNEMFAFGLRKV
ncbi:carboxymethylenebutenolidase [Fusarium beomiforme]|uniref:Carboxymethylenebutenolidase n=1 Tax=Fusarium beomiforme TaxID=44412 RepID=A0A9P5AVN9_9HYPO|nr:carboxymethylenebutenolidase [Fusarium beomiforme]